LCLARKPEQEQEQEQELKISYRTAGTGSYTTLADDSTGDLVVEFRPSMQGVSQVDPLFGAANAKVFAKGNRAWQIALAVSKEHASVDAAAEFLATHAAALPDLVDLKVEVGAKTMYAHRAAMTQFDPGGETNKSTLIAYGWVAEKYTTTAP
jgi:hypothetical protein